MAVNSIRISDKCLVQVCLIEVHGDGHITVNDRHFDLKQGAKVDITPSLHEGTNTINFFVNTDSLRENPFRFFNGKQDWIGRFEVYIDNRIAGSYSKEGTYFIGGKTNLIASLEVNIFEDVSEPSVMHLINQLQKVQGITDANKADFPHSHPHILFKNGVAIHTWKNYAGVDHAFIADHSGQCVYGGYVGWIHSEQLKSVLQKIHDELEEHIV